MSVTIRARTARQPHHCESCATYGTSLPPTIAPGHRYLLHTSFPDGYTDTSPAPWSIKECIACAEEREQGAGMLVAAACISFCCGDTPCALPFQRGCPGHEHSCRQCCVRSAVAA